MVCLFFFAEIRNCLDGVGYQVVPSFSLPNIRRIVLIMSGCVFGNISFHDMMNI